MHSNMCMFIQTVAVTCSLLVSPALCIVQSEKVFWMKETPVTLGKDSKLFCNASAVPDCCDFKTRRWVISSSDTVLLSNGVSTNAEKYTEILKEGGFTIFIKNITLNDVNISYTCSYGFEQYTDVLFLDDNIPSNPTDKATSGSILVPVIISVAVVIVLIILITILVCYILHVRRKDKYDTTEQVAFQSNNDKNISERSRDKQKDNLIEVKDSDVTEDRTLNGSDNVQV